MQVRKKTMNKNKENNKNDNSVVSGIMLIVIGLVALMVTIFDIEIVWSELAKLWPVLIIVFGISILPFNKLLKSILVIVVMLISFLLYYNGVKDNDDVFQDVSTCTSAAETADIESVGVISDFDIYRC